MFKSVFVSLVTLQLAFASNSVAEESLPRRVSLGTQVQPVSDEAVQRCSLKNARGVEVLTVFPDTNAAKMGVVAGDVLLSIAGSEIASIPQFLEMVAGLRAGTDVELKLNRAGEQQTLSAKLAELPRESSDELDIEYSHVETAVGRLRTVLTLPKQDQPTPAVLLLSGLATAFVEHPSADPTGMQSLANGLSSKGLAVLRVDKPGCGDSEGGPARDVDFDTVVAGYVAALKKLKEHPRVEAHSIWLLGASMGGVQAPLVAAQEDVQGIAVFGTMVPNWNEFIQASTRHQLMLAGLPAEQVEQQVAEQTAGWHYLVFENQTPDDIAVKQQDLMDWVDSTWVDGKYFSGIHYTFFQQAAKAEIAKAWEQFSGKVLALWGDADVVTSAAGHQWIAQVVDRQATGRAIYKALPGIDHNMRDTRTETTASAPVPVASALVDSVADWIKNG